MKAGIVLISVLVLSFQIKGQVKPVLEGKPILMNQDIQNGFFGEDETGIYSTRTNTIGPSLHLFVEKYDKNSLDLIFSKEINASDLQIETNFKISYAYRAVFVDGKVFCFFQLFDNKKD